MQERLTMSKKQNNCTFSSNWERPPKAYIEAAIRAKIPVDDFQNAIKDIADVTNDRLKKHGYTMTATIQLTLTRTSMTEEILPDYGQQYRTDI